MQLKLENLRDFHFYSSSSVVVVVSQCALCHGYKPCATVFTENTLSTRLLPEGKSVVGACPVVSKHCVLQTTT